MAKIEKASESVVELFEKIRENTTIPNWVTFEVLCCDKQKQLIKPVKSNDLVELLSDGVNFAIIINESIFNQLPDDLQELAIEDCLGGVSVSESDSVSYEKEDFVTRTGTLKKHGHEKVISLYESTKSLFDTKKQQEDEAKALTKGKRGRKPKS